jgi:hypothetical protein
MAATAAAAREKTMNFLKQVWLSVRSNPAVVAGYSAAAGAAVSYLQGALSRGDFSFQSIDWNQLATLAGTAALAAVVHLYTPPPGSNPNVAK